MLMLLLMLQRRGIDRRDRGVHVHHVLVLLVVGAGGYIFFRLHASILEPDLDLALGQHQLLGDLDAAATRQIPIGVELLFQLDRLVTRVRLTGSLRSVFGVIWNKGKKENLISFWIAN